MVAVFPVDAFDPVAPAVACGTSALSEAALLEPDVTAVNRSVMPDGAPMSELPERPKQATSIVFATVVVIDGAELVAWPPEALMGLVASTLKYALIPPATLEEETVKMYGPGSDAAVPATFQNVAVVRWFVVASEVVTIDVQPAGVVIIGAPELARAVTDASMISFATVAPGRLRLSDVAEPPPTPLLVAPRNPIPVMPARVSAV